MSGFLARRANALRGLGMILAAVLVAERSADGAVVLVVAAAVMEWSDVSKEESEWSMYQDVNV